MNTPLGGIVASSAVAWSSSSCFLTVPFGNILRSYDISKSPPQFISLHVGHHSAVTALVSLPGMQVLSASKDGTLRIWDIQSGQSMRTIEVANPISHIAYDSSHSVVCYTRVGLSIVDITVRSKSRSRFVTRALYGIFKREEGLVACADRCHLVAVAEGDALHVASAKNKYRSYMTLHSSHAYTSVAISADASRVAVGDANGVISIFQGLDTFVPQLQDGRVIVRSSSLNISKLHWHSSPVRALSFSHNDSMLLSAGNEAVLVSWRISRTNYGNRSFLPRLKAPVLGISVSPDETLYALTHADNAVRIIEQRTNEVMHTIRGVAAPLKDFCGDNPNMLLSSRLDYSISKSFISIPDSRIPGKVWVSGNSSSLQLLDVLRGDQIIEIPIAPRNVIYEPTSTSEGKKHPNHLSVKLLALHGTLDLLSTIDFQDLSTPDTALYGTKKGIYTLRLWRRKSSEDFLELKAVIINPHGSGAGVTDMCFHPTMPWLLTSSSNGKFKLWAAIDPDLETWRCEFEKNYKGLPCNALAFSEDGSLLAAAHRNVLTLWSIEHVKSSSLHFQACPDPGTEEGKNELRMQTSEVVVEHMRALVHPPRTEIIQSLSFVYDKAPIFLAATSYGIYAWNAITQGIWWSLRFSCMPTRLVTDWKSKRFAIPIYIPPLVPAAQEILPNGIVGPTVSNHPEELDSNQRTSKSHDKKSRSLAGGNVVKPKLQINAKGNAKVAKRPRTPCLKPVPRLNPDKLDIAIAVFRAGSPVPVQVSRLPPGVHAASLAFVEHPGAEPGTNTPLICFDSDLSVKFVDNDEKSDHDISSIMQEALPQSGEQSTAHGRNALDNLLGAEWREDGIPSTRVTSEVITEASENDIELLKHSKDAPINTMHAVLQTFSGSLHIQAPVSVKVSGFMDLLLQSKRGEGKNVGEILRSVESKEHVESLPQNQDGLGSIVAGDDIKSDNDNRSFCRNLIRLDRSKSADAKT